ncbi:MAG TPA: class I SAM-dependent methyltransferase [Candidatus Paceibacterota bacterium]|nr:class I SAM-dependent methyltransferase [Candidatus Paceibacterota bacterium]
MNENEKRKKPKNTSWGPVADWYDAYLEVTPESYQAAVIAPNLLRVLALKKGEHVIDIACGQGYFTRAFAEAGAHAVGADISKELITVAKKRSPKIDFHVAPAHKLSFAKDASYDAATIVLAIQNIENIFCLLPPTIFFAYMFKVSCDTGQFVRNEVVRNEA